jgi:signal transduction histidine kinase
VTLRAKLILAQAPLALAVIVIGAVSSATTTALGHQSDLILRDNYRSVLAAQRMKEAVERIDSGAVFIALDRRDLAEPQIATDRAVFENELAVEEKNITERGEQADADELRARWTAYLAAIDRFRARTGAAADPAELRRVYFAELQPSFVGVKDEADEILALNQDAMVRKSDRASRTAASFQQGMILAAIGALIAGLVASMTLTARLLRPLSVLGQAVRRLGEGDLRARAQLAGGDEIAQLGRDFNVMADHLEQYRKSSLGELLLAQRAAQGVIDSLEDPVIVLGLGGEVLGANAAAERLLRVRLESGSGDPLAALDATMRATIERVRAHVLGGKGAYAPRSLEEAIRFASPEGPRQLLPRATPLYAEEGGVAGVTVVLQDVTRLVRFDELKSNLVATVAHEVRTPLTSLRMAIHLCTEGAVGPLTEKQADLLFAARDDCERLQTIIDELLDLSRIQAGRIELSARPVPAEELTIAAVDAHQAAAGEKKITLTSEVLPATGVVTADPDRVALVFTNLISNAIRHTPSGGAVTLRARAVEGAIRFEVNDTGEGIPKEHHAALFEKFYQVPGAHGGGVGLGLFIVKEIVTAHGGAVGVESVPGNTTFWFTLPTV